METIWLIIHIHVIMHYLMNHFIDRQIIIHDNRSLPYGILLWRDRDGEKASHVSIQITEYHLLLTYKHVRCTSCYTKMRCKLCTLYQLLRVMTTYKEDAIMVIDDHKVYLKTKASSLSQYFHIENR